MLLNKKIIIFGMMFLLFASLVSAEVCEVDRIKQVLKKILFLYYTEPGNVPLTKDEVKDMLVFYLSINDQNITVDCSAFGSRSNKPISDVVNAGENVPDKIPACADGTKYGECSKARPAYCYAGAVYSKCDLCGCPTNSVCGKSQKCETASQNITCYKDIDCGQISFTGSYYCVNNYIVKDILNYTCANPGTTNSKCVLTNGTVWLTYCNPTYNQLCISGKSTCQTTVNDSAPTVSISVSPTTIAQGQFFNVTVTGTDDVGLADIWWWGSSTGDAELNKAHMYSCNSAKFCMNSWLVSTNATGVLKSGANSRDTAYPVAGQPHQASEGAGIAYATITVTSGIADSVNLHSLTIINNSLKVVYSKNFITCVHLLTETYSITHVQNYYCAQGNYTEVIQPLSSFTSNIQAGQKLKLCHGNNYNVCSGLVTITSSNQTALTTNQTNQTCEINKVVDFEDSPHLAFHLSWNPDLGTEDAYNLAQDDAARAWLRAKGIEMNGTPNGFVWGTKISGPVGVTGVIIGDASPNFLENDQGISDNEILSIRFLDTLVKSVTVRLTSTPSNVTSINNIPSTVIMEAFDTAGNLVTSVTKTFTGVTNSVYTPTTMSLSASDFNIAKITLRTTQYSYGGVWLEDISLKVRCT